MSKTTTDKRGDLETGHGEQSPAGPVPVSESSPETERLRTENETLKDSLKMRNAHEQIMQSLTKAGAISPDLLFNSAQTSLQFDDSGQLANGAAVLEHLKKTFPEQFQQAIVSGSVNGGSGRGNSAVYLTKEALSRMTAAEIGKLDWQEVRRVLSER